MSSSPNRSLLIIMFPTTHLMNKLTCIVVFDQSLDEIHVIIERKSDIFLYPNTFAVKSCHG